MIKIIENYSTGDITNNNPIDVNYPDNSYCADFLNPNDLKYMETQKNKTGKIINMSPEEYYEICAKEIFNVSVDNLKRGRQADKQTMDKLIKILTVDKKQFPLPYVDLTSGGQEGLHRMQAIGEVYGWDFEVPVLVIDYVNKRLGQLNDIWDYWINAIRDAQEKVYDSDTWETDFVEEVQYNLNESVEGTIVEGNYTVIVVNYDIDDNYGIDISLKEFSDIMSPYEVRDIEISEDAENSNTYAQSYDDFFASYDWIDDDTFDWLSDD